MRRLTVGLVVVALALSAAATAHAKRPAAKRCGQAHPVACLKMAAHRHGVSFALLRSIAWCESRLIPTARNPSGASGLVQFMPGTWANTPYARRSPFRARWNALAGAWLIRRVGTGPWAASRHCWG